MPLRANTRHLHARRSDRHPRHVQLALVHTQGALVTLARGETLRQQAALAPNDRVVAVLEKLWLSSLWGGTGV